MTPRSLDRRALAPLLALLAAACAPRTELVVGITTDLAGGADPLTSVHLTVQRGGAAIADQTWSVGPDGPDDLPGSVGIYTDDGSEAHLVLQLTGTLRSGRSLKRDAVVDLAHGATLFLRMMLAASCLDVDCDEQTCVEGKCRPIFVDHSQLPAYRAGMERSLECDSGSAPQRTRDGQKMDYLPGPGPQACGERSTCVEGTCYRAFATCSAGGQGGVDVDLASDVNNCGACGAACPSLSFTVATCSGGACGFTCLAGHADCDRVPATGCEVDTGADARNCGGCGRACAAPNAITGCVKGACTISGCATGYADCDGQYDTGCEQNTATDLASCGACGAQCAAANGQGRCVMGACAVASCMPTFADCDKVPGNGCEAALLTDALNCGACGRACAADNAVAACAGGACVVMSCMKGFADCDAASADGCEANLAADPDNCGGCGIVCSGTNMATRTCVAGKCAGDCKMGYADCNGNKQSDGCEVNTASDGANCGACAKPCAGNQVCSNSTCQLGCQNQTLCNRSCVDTTSDIRYCGNCFTACNAPNAINFCQGGVCKIACPVDKTSTYYDCDGKVVNGCESDITKDAQNCGGCGKPCSAAGITPLCAGGECKSGTCKPGFADCDGDKRSNGCEIQVDNNPDNCGQGGAMMPSGCGVVCSNNNMATRTCASGSCNGTCKPDYADCDGDKRSNGCETNLKTDTANCGACGNRCGHPHIASACNAGQCSLACDTGFADCNSNKLTDGCETAVGTDPYNCGGCKMSCSPLGIMTMTCTAGACTGTCLPGWGDCNHDRRSDGCETPLTTDQNCGACGVACPGLQRCKSGRCGG